MHPDTRKSIGSKTWLTVPLTMLAQLAAVGVFVLASMMATGMVPPPYSDNTAYAYMEVVPPPPPPPPPPIEEKKTPPPDVSKNAAPLVTPKEIKKETGNETKEEERTETTTNKSGTVPGNNKPEVVETPPPPKPPEAPVRVGGHIRAPQKTRDVRPTYPPIAQSARVQGIVILEATIGLDGAVKDVKVLRSIPLLDQAAIDAVRQWVFTPTLLNGVPVPVIMTATVQFTLQ